MQNYTIRNYFFVLFIFCISLSYAQYRDTLHAAFISKKSFDFRYESKNSFSNGDRIEVAGIKVGVTFGKKISIGGGYSWLRTSLSEKKLLPDLGGGVAYKDNQLSFRYLCYYIDFVYFKSKRWTLSSQVEFGFGLSKFKFLENGEPDKTLGKLVLLYNPAINIKFKIFKWVGISSTIGYRFMLLNDRSVGKKLNSPLISVGASLYFDELCLAIFPKSKIFRKWFGESEW